MIFVDISLFKTLVSNQVDRDNSVLEDQRRGVLFDGEICR